MAELDDIREELALAREEIASLRIKATTTLSGTEFLTLLMVGPVIAAFLSREATHPPPALAKPPHPLDRNHGLWTYGFAERARP